MKTRNVIGYGLLALITILYFIPKTNLYYQLEHKLQPHGIIIHNEHVDDKWFWLEITDAQLYVQKIDSLHVNKTRIMLLGLYNRIDLEGVLLASTLRQFVPGNINSAKLHYALYNPFNITGTILGDFGEAEVNVDLYERLFTADIQVSQLMRSRFSSTLKNFIRDKKGVYHYEYRF